jgi:CubicO group peptidase (beta-lactamase class C family)
VAGTRRAGQDIPVGIEDRFHIGSDSKAFTSLLAGQFVEEGKLRWDSTLAEVFPELKDKMDAEFAKITLQELLSHSSGLASDGSEILDLISRSYMQDGNMDEVRYWMVKETAPKPLDHRVSPTKVRKVPQDSCQLPGRKGFSAIPELPRRDLV